MFTLGKAAQTLGYSRQCQRWFITYSQEGSEELLVSRAGERGRRELVTEEAWAELEEAMKEGEIASIAQAHAFLPRRGISCLGKGFRIVYCCPTAAKIPVA